MRRDLLVSIAIVALVAIGCSADGDDSNRSEVEAVEHLADEHSAAWTAQDPARIAASYVEDGVFVDTIGREWKGRERIVAFAEEWGWVITESERTGPAEMQDDGTFVFPVELVHDGDTMVGDVIATVQDGLFARYDWVDGSPQRVADDGT